MVAVVIAIPLIFLLLAALFFRRDLSREELSEYISSESKFLELPGGANAHYREEGDKSGPTLVLVHGGFGSLHNWEPWIEYLKADYRVISCDLPGHGLTGRVPGDVYTRDSMVEFISGLVSELGVERFSMAGNSMGGGVALAYALKYPERIEALLLSGSEGIPNTEHGYDDGGLFGIDMTLPGEDAGDMSLSLRERAMLRFSNPWVVRQVLRYLSGNKSAITSEVAGYFEKILRHEGNRYAMVLLFRGYASSVTDPRDLEPRLGKVSAPVLLQFGAQDRLVPPRVGERFHELLPNSELIVYEGCGHIPMLDIPERSARDAISFLQKHGMGASPASASTA